MIVIHAKAGNPPWHQWYREAFLEGFAQHPVGKVTVSTEDHADSNYDDVHIVFGPNYWPNVTTTAKRWISVNRCFFGPVAEWVALGWNGFNGGARFPDIRRMTMNQVYARKEKWGHLLPKKTWTGEGGYKILIGEYPSTQIDPAELRRFYEGARNAQALGSTKLIYRPHPQAAMPEYLNLMVSASADPDKAELVYTFASTFGVECRLRGVPTKAHPNSVAAAFPFYQREFVEHVLFAQWHIEEVKKGLFWEFLRDA